MVEDPILALTFLIFIVVVSVIAVVQSFISEKLTEYRKRKAKYRGIKSAILYKLESGEEILVSCSWVRQKAEETARRIRKNNQGITSILRRGDFREVTGEEFEPERLRVESVEAGTEDQYPHYKNSGIGEGVIYAG